MDIVNLLLLGLSYWWEYWWANCECKLYIPTLLMDSEFPFPPFFYPHISQNPLKNQTNPSECVYFQALQLDFDFLKNSQIFSRILNFSRFVA